MDSHRGRSADILLGRIMILALILGSSRVLHPVWRDIGAARLVAEAVATAWPEFDDANRLEVLVGVPLKIDCPSLGEIFKHRQPMRYQGCLLKVARARVAAEAFQDFDPGA